MSKRVWTTKNNRQRVFLLLTEEEDTYILMNRHPKMTLLGDSRCWLLSTEEESAVELKAEGGIQVQIETNVITVIFDNDFEIIQHPTSAPHCDVFGNGYEMSFIDGVQLAETLARFYWGTLLPSVIEKTAAAEYPDWKGYVVSTVEADKYAGTYPDVDHEFQCKGRLASSGEFELGIVKRMLELQFKMMREDPAGLWRNPCSVQPDGTREYHIRRSSMDGSVNANMFLITGNVEVLEISWLYFARTKNESWLQANIENLEGAASLIEELTDRYGRVWSDVFYEDQVMKDGTECMSASLAANALKQLAQLENYLQRQEQSEHYLLFAEKIESSIVQEAPIGFWDEEHQRFIDWIDRNGKSHDHTHLLANILPVIFGNANKKQSEAVYTLLLKHFENFQRFPTFLSPLVEDYTDAEIGDGGPYDLCAAGRYWCWDAAYWACLGKGDILKNQLLKVADQAKQDNFRMGERYDMNYIYYIDDKNWHGASYYYEYPNVFFWVLIHEYLGFGYAMNCDLMLEPKLADYGKVRMDSYGVEYEYTEPTFTIHNLTDKMKSVDLDLTKLYKGRAADLKSSFTLTAGEVKTITVN